MQTIHKVSLNPLPQALTAVHIPAGAEFIHVHKQRDRACVWYRCNTNAQLAERRLYAIYTGHPEPSGPYRHRYLGTVHMDVDEVIHVFEVDIK